jgi:hypothetical protein
VGIIYNLKNYLSLNFQSLQMNIDEVNIPFLEHSQGLRKRRPKEFQMLGDLIALFVVCSTKSCVAAAAGDGW